MGRTKGSGSGGPGADVSVESGHSFWNGSSGRWAGEQFMRALNEGREITPSVLRTLDTLRKDEWIEFDDALVEAAVIRLRGIADLRAAGLVRPVRGGLGKTVFQYEKITDMNPAQVSMDGIARTEGDRQEFSLGSLPLPIVHKDFFINLRTLIASRERGESLDTTQVRTAGRLIAEQLESMLFNGGPQFGGVPIYGLTNHPNVNTASFAGAEAWDAAGKTGEEILVDVLAMLTKLEADRMFGPYGLYLPTAYSVKMSEDFKANSDKTIRQRLLEVEGLKFVTVADQMPSAKVVMVQMTSDVVSLVEGEPMQTIQWDVEGGFQVNFKGFALAVPLVRADTEGRSGIVVMS